MKVPPALRWALIAFTGLLIAVAVAVLASKLTSQRIGLSSEPLGAGQALAPAGRPPGDRDGHPGSGGGAGTSSTTTTVTVPATSTTTTAPPTSATTTGGDSGSDGSGEGGSSEDD